jgi:thiamine biosynthesis protein ThiS
MQIVVNGETKAVTQDINLTDLIIELDLKNKRLAIEVNQELVTRSEFDTYTLSTGDIVEIVQAIGGG